MRDSAFKWWNGAVNFDDTLTDPPEMASPTDMQIVWQDLSPIFHTHVHFTDDLEEYWSNVHVCFCKLINNTNISDPKEDFPEFVISLYQHRNLIKPTNVEACINYAEQFCPQDNNTFFVQDFLYGVSDPFLSVDTMHALNKQNREPWASYVHQFGAVEHIFDLFITFLQPANRSVENEYEGFRVVLADLMTSMVIDEGKRLILGDKLVSSLYSRLLNLIIYSKTDACVSFARNAIAINKEFLPLIPIEEAATRVIALLNSSPPSKRSHNMVVEYCIAQAGKFITFTTLINIISKHAGHLFDLNALYRLAQTKIDAKMTAVRTLAKMMTHNKIHARAAASVLSKILGENPTNANIKDWMSQYVTRVFVFIKLGGRREKYLRRIHVLCELFSDGTFDSCEYMSKIIGTNANAAYSIGGDPKFLEDYFVLGPDQPTAKYFAREFGKFEKMRMKLKTFPFKAGSTQLYEQTRAKPTKGKGAGEERGREVLIENDLQDTGLMPQSMKYVYRSLNASTIDQQNCVFTLEDFIDTEKAKYDKIKRRTPKQQRVNMRHFVSSAQLVLTGLRAIVAENEIAIRTFQSDALMSYMDIARDIINCLNTQQHLMADVKMLTRDLNHGSADNPMYRAMKERRVNLKRVAKAYTEKYRCPRYGEELAAALSMGNFKFDPSLQYAHPSHIDDLAVEYLRRSPFGGMIDATASILEDGTIDAAASTVWELNGAIIDTLGLRMDQNVLVMYHALIRCMFDAAFYLLSPSPLNRFKSSAVEFLRRAEEFSRRPIEDLNLQGHRMDHRRRQPVSTLFRPRVHCLAALEFMTNPIDMMHHIYQMYLLLPAAAEAPTLTPPEMQMMMLALVASSPPSNAVAIARFLNKWGGLVTASPVLKAKQMFVSSVSHLIDIDTAKD